TVYSEQFEPNRAFFKEDEFLVVQGKVSEDRFNGGLRVSAEKVMDIAAARIHYGRQFVLSLTYPTPQIGVIDLKEALSSHRSDTGLPVTVHYTGQGIGCDIVLGDVWRISPNDGLQAFLMARLGKDAVTVEY
ncbi:MAG: DNA polymerase III subunit alpha, partial [Glaciimonas sp.]|nr:DNA polymerase III subunit alpha [Glaciimonas sp.]